MSTKSETYTPQLVARDEKLIFSLRVHFAGMSLRGAGLAFAATAGYLAAAESTAGYVAVGAAAAGSLAGGLRLGAERLAALVRYRNYHGYDDVDPNEEAVINIGAFRRSGRAVATVSAWFAGSAIEGAAGVARYGIGEAAVPLSMAAALGAVGIAAHCVTELSANTHWGDHGPANASTEPWLHELLRLAALPAPESPAPPTA